MTRLTNLFGTTAILDIQPTIHGAFYIAICAVLGIAVGYGVLVALKSMLSTNRGYYTRVVIACRKRWQRPKAISSRGLLGTERRTSADQLKSEALEWLFPGRKGTKHRLGAKR
jgi:hypothetical protein